VPMLFLKEIMPSLSRKTASLLLEMEKFA
jgi:hypothetical protein